MWKPIAKYAQVSTLLFSVIMRAMCLPMGGKRPLLAMTGFCVFNMPIAVSLVNRIGSHGSRISSTFPLHYPVFAAGSLHQRHCSMCVDSEEDQKPRKKVVFLGTPDVAALSLKLLLRASRNGEGGGFDVVRVVSNPPAKAGRKKVLQPCPVQALAESEGLPVMTPKTARDEDFLSELDTLCPDLCVTAAYGQFLPRRFLDIPKFGTLNVHPSLLPRYRGASPVQRCLEAGDSKTGVTVAFTVLKMDAGPVVKQTVRELNGSEKAPDLLRELFDTGTRELIECLPQVWDCSTKKEPQDDTLVVKAAKISVEEARCCFKTISAATIHNKVRAFAGWPGTWASFSWGKGSNAEARKMKIITTELGEPAPEGEVMNKCPSLDKEVILRGDALEVTCGDGSVLKILEVQPMNKKVMSAKSFANGLRGEPLTWVELESEEAVVA